LARISPKVTVAEAARTSRHWPGIFHQARKLVGSSEPRGSLNETQHWLRRAYRRKLMTKAQVNLLKPLVEELGPRLNAYLKSIRVRGDDNQCR